MNDLIQASTAGVLMVFRPRGWIDRDYLEILIVENVGLNMMNAELAFVHGTNAVGKTQWCLANIGCKPNDVGWYDYEMINGDQFHGRVNAWTMAFFFLEKETKETREMKEIATGYRLHSHPRFNELARKNSMKVLIISIPSDTAKFLITFDDIREWNISELYMCSPVRPDILEKKMEGREQFNQRTIKLERMGFALPSSCKKLYVEYPTDEEGIYLTDEKSGETTEIDLKEFRNRSWKSFLGRLKKDRTSWKRRVKAREKRSNALSGREEEFNGLHGKIEESDRRHREVEKELDSCYGTILGKLKHDILEEDATLGITPFGKAVVGNVNGFTEKLWSRPEYVSMEGKMIDLHLEKKRLDYWLTAARYEEYELSKKMKLDASYLESTKHAKGELYLVEKRIKSVEDLLK